MNKIIKKTVNIDIEYQGIIKKFCYGNVHIVSMLEDIEKWLNEMANAEQLVERLEKWLKANAEQPIERLENE